MESNNVFFLKTKRLVCGKCQKYLAERISHNTVSILCRPCNKELKDQPGILSTFRSLFDWTPTMVSMQPLNLNECEDDGGDSAS